MDSMEDFLSRYKESIGLLSLLISLFTLLLAYRINKQFGRSYINTKQIDHVCTLIQKLNASKIEVLFSTRHKEGGISDTGHSIHFNIFELGHYDKIQKEGINKEYESEIVLFDTGSNQLLGIKGLIDHPLTPRKIADELMNFYVPFAWYLDSDSPVFNVEELNFVRITTNIWEENVMINHDRKGRSLIQPEVTCFCSWLHLKESAKRLKTTINKWLIDNGIHENNIREDFKSKTP